MRDQRIRDPIHDLIKFSAERKFDEVLWKLVQTSEFQRLRRIAQLGFAEIVYPGATHTRFSHSLGAMEMARKMLAVLKQNKVVSESENNENATICAALLHDVGHGPLSHVFEEVSESCGIKIHHEDWTKRIIRDSNIGTILRDFDSAIHQDVLSFFEVEHGSDLYSTIVSSQFDADRLDFMLRDRYFTGVKFGSIDPAWIFDCLQIQLLSIEANSEAEKYRFVVSQKGFSAIENYFYAYTELYSKVYFHKTSRAAQIMMKNILSEVVKDPALLPKENPLRSYFESTPMPTLEAYCRLDDSVIWSTVRFLAENGKDEVSTLSKRLLDRNLFKCFELPKAPKEESDPILAHQFENKLKEKKIKFYKDRIQRKGYKAYETDYLKDILVSIEGEKYPKALHKLSNWVADMSRGTPLRYYFEETNDRKRAKDIFKEIS